MRPTDRFLMERFIKGSVTVEGDWVAEDGFLGCVNPKLGPSDDVPDLRLISLDIETSYTENILYTIAVYSHDIRKVFMVAPEVASIPHVDCLPDEASVIRQFLQWCAAYDPDVIIGWNVVAFDLRLALIGFRGHGFDNVVRPDFCHHLILEALIFQGP